MTPPDDLRARLASLAGDDLDALYEWVTTDPLTGTRDRRYFDDALGKEHARCERYGRTFSLIAIDVDQFKAVNDTYGHVAGDAVLRGIAKVLLAGVRRADTVARMGGDEFLVLLPETDLSGARAVAERLRADVASARFEAGGDALSATITVGVAQWTGGDPMEVRRKADTKGSGRMVLD